MTVFPDQQLPFWSFFHKLEQQLSYERWIDKYKLLLKLLMDDHLPYSDDGAALLSACKALYLQDIRDEQKFVLLFQEAWEAERKKWEAFFRDAKEREEVREAASVVNPALPPENRLGEKIPPSRDAAAAGRAATEAPLAEQQARQTQPAEGEKETYFFTPPFDVEKPDALPDDDALVQRAYNFQDEYLPVTRREMVKGWQYLRRHEKGAPTTDLDVKKTVVKIARENVFTSPEYRFGTQNREDALIFFVDCNGSMMPFHEFSRRLVKTARTYGGHREAAVYYFQNAPTGYVFNTFQLTGSVKLKQALARANVNFSIAVVISDAGFARSYGPVDRHEARLHQLQHFLATLNQHCAHVLWLNPIPENRWYMPTAAGIRSQVLKMASVFDTGMNPFQSITRTLLKHRDS